MVTGVAAILKALEPEYQSHQPQGFRMDPKTIKDVLVKSADPIQTGEPDKRLGTGCYADPNDQINTGCRLNAHRAVAWFLPPAGVSLAPPHNTTPTSATFDWIKNPDFDLKTPDFAFLKIYRATHQGVTQSDTLVATIPPDRNGDLVQFSLTDAGLTPATTYRYKAFTIDKAGLVFESNEISATIQAAPIFSPFSIKATIPVGTLPTGLALSPNAARLYGVNANPFSFLRRGSVSVIDTLTNATIGAPIPLDPGSTEQIGLSPDGTRGYVAVGNFVDVLNLQTNTLTASVTVATGGFDLNASDIALVAFSPDGERAYVSNRSENTVAVIDTKPESPTFHTVIAKIPVVAEPYGLAVTPDGTRVYVASRAQGVVSVVNTATNAVSGTVVYAPTSFAPSTSQIAISADGRRAFVVIAGSPLVHMLDTDPASERFNRAIDSIPVGSGLGDVAVSSDGKELLVTARDPVSALVVYDADPASANFKQEKGRVPLTLPGFIAFRGQLDAYAYVTGGGLEGRVYVIQKRAGEFPSYDFAADFVSLNGNIPSVAGCTLNPRNNQFRSFFDEFTDGLLDTGCTAKFQRHGLFEESGGLLHMRSQDAFVAGGFANHVIQYRERFADGNGSTTIAVGFRPDVPRPMPLFSGYGVNWIDADAAPFLPGLSMQVTTLTDGRVVLVAGRNAEPGRVFRGRLVNLGDTTTLVFAALFDDRTNIAQPIFSVNGGITFQGWRNPDGTPFMVPFFTQSSRAILQVFWFVKLPDAGLSLFSTAASAGGRWEQIELEAGEIGEAFVSDGIGILKEGE